MPDPTQPSPGGRRWRPSRRTVLKTGAAAGWFLGGAVAVGGGYLLGNRRSDRSMEDLDGRPLRILSGRDDTANGQRGLLVDQWNLRFPDHPAEMVELPGVADLQYGAIHAALQAGDPAVDVVNLDLPWIADFAKAGRLLELERPTEGGYLGRPLSAGEVDGKLRALPFNTDVGMLYYRLGAATDYATGTLSAEDAARIADWEDLRRVAEGMVVAGGFEGGIAMQLDAYEGFTVSVWEYLLANRVEAKSDGSIDFGDPSPAVAQLEWLSRELHEPVGEGTMILQESLRFAEDASLEAFRTGRTAFLRHWPRAFQDLRSCDREFDVGVVPMPGRVLGGQSLAVSAASERPDAAVRLIEFLTGPMAQQRLFEPGGFASTREEPYYDAIAQTHLLDPAVEAPCDDGGSPRVEAAQLFRALTGRDPEDRLDPGPEPGTRPAVERYTRFSRVFQEVVHGELEADSTPDLSRLQDLLDEAVAGR
ncbi:hypothetical protein GCM10009830_08970 [Glycomyces endophyticus]|uniref:Extracellular solute-binding protein n=1 Tax=Glycomyces endophyticus TaxID=480996 RepID=A0ABP4S4J0_9ACTN